MDTHTTVAAGTATPGAVTDLDLGLERIHTQRLALKSKHSQALSRLMDERDDLRGVHALADFVDDGLRWSA